MGPADDELEVTVPPVTMSTRTRIGDDVWIGINATILKGVSIGSGAIIAAGAVVADDVPAHALVAGNPAVVVRQEVLHAPSPNG